MIREFLAQQVGFPLQDRIMQTNISGTLKFLRESQYWDRSRLEEYRLTKLKELIESAFDHIPYYSRLFRSIGLNPGDIKTLDDIKRIPVLTKKIMREEGDNLLVPCSDMKYVKTGKTGGTTGVPVKVYKDVRSRSFTWASYYRWYEWMGLEVGDRTCTLWGTRSVLSMSRAKKLRDTFRNFLQNKKDINSFNMNDIDLERIYKKIKRFKPKILKGYTSALLLLADYIEKNSLSNINPMAISTTSEMLLPHDRVFLEKVFNAPVFDQYGCGEVSAISYECSKHCGLHINQEHVLCEILDENDRVVYNKPGRVIVTDLDNYIMPVIRFDTGDTASIFTRECTCGVTFPLMSSISGRSADTIILKNGSKVHGVFFTDILFELGIMTDKFSRFQVHQITPGKINFILENNQAIDNKIIIALKNALSRFFDDVNIMVIDHIPNGENGKFRYILNESTSGLKR